MAATLSIHRDRDWWPHDLVRRPCCGLPPELKPSGRWSPEGRRSIGFQLIMLLSMLSMPSMLAMLAMLSISDVSHAGRPDLHARRTWGVFLDSSTCDRSPGRAAWAPGSPR